MIINFYFSINYRSIFYSNYLFNFKNMINYMVKNNFNCNSLYDIYIYYFLNCKLLILMLFTLYLL